MPDVNAANAFPSPHHQFSANNRARSTVQSALSFNTLFLIEPSLGDSIGLGAGAAHDFNHQEKRPDIRPLSRTEKRGDVGNEEIRLHQGTIVERDVRGGPQDSLDAVSRQIGVKDTVQVAEKGLVPPTRRRRVLATTFKE